MDLHLWLSLAAICFLGALSPGPSLALVVKNTIAGGKQQGVASAISHGFGVTLYAIFTVTGIGLIITKTPFLFQLIQYCGAAFLLYLGWQAIKSSQTETVITTSENTSTNATQVNGWRDGFLIAFLNPKLAIFFLALFSQFLAPDNTLVQKVMMVTTVGTIDTLWYCLVAYSISRKSILTKLQSNQSWVQKITGSLLILLAIRVVWL